MVSATLDLVRSIQRALADLGLAAQADDRPPERDPDSPLMLQVFLPDGRMDGEAATALVDEDVVWDMSRSPFPDTGVARGVEGVRSFVPVTTFRVGGIMRMERYVEWEAAIAATGVAG